MDKITEAPSSVPMSQGMTHDVTYENRGESNIPAFIQEKHIDASFDNTTPEESNNFAQELLTQAKEEGPSHTLESLAHGTSRAQKNVDQKAQYIDDTEKTEMQEPQEMSSTSDSEQEDEQGTEQKTFQEIWNEVFNEKAKEGPVDLDEINKLATMKFEAYKIAHQLVKDPTAEVVDNLKTALQEGKFNLETFIKATAKDTESAMPHMLKLQERQKDLQEKSERTPEEEEELKRLSLALMFFALGYLEGKRNTKDEKDKKEKSLWELLMMLVHKLINEATDFDQFTKSGVPSTVEKPTPLKMLVFDTKTEEDKKETPERLAA